MASRSRVLLLIPATSYRADDFLAAARHLDIDVTVGSDHRQVLADLVPGSSLYVDFGQVMNSVNTILAFAQSQALDAIVASDDAALELAAVASQRLGLAYNTADAVRASADKLRFREFTSGAGLPSPKYACVDNIADAVGETQRIGFPCVFKPRSLGASQGVIRVDNAQQAEHAGQRIFDLLEHNYPTRHPHRSSLLIEQYLPGREYAVDGLLVNNGLEMFAVFDKPEAMDGPFFEETLFVRPSREPVSVLNALSTTVFEAATALGLRSGPIHAELRIDHSAAQLAPMLLEIAPRSIGGLCSNALPFSDGSSLEAVILRAALGRSRSAKPSETASGVMMIPIPRSGVLRGVDGIEAAKSVSLIDDVRITINLTEHVQALPEGNRYLGFIFASGETPDEVEAALRCAHQELAFEIECATS